jgi:hypothetical protein
VSDLLWGRLDGAERIITALLPLKENATLRDQLIAEAHEAILEEFDARQRLGSIALDPARNQAIPLTKADIAANSARRHCSSRCGTLFIPCATDDYANPKPLPGEPTCA